MKRMKKLMLLTGIIELCVVAGMMIHSGHASSGSQKAVVIAHEATSAPFRDGHYLGKLAAARGGESQISTGRWATEADRASFKAGFEQGYHAGVVLRASKASAN